MNAIDYDPLLRAIQPGVLCVFGVAVVTVAACLLADGLIQVARHIAETPQRRKDRQIAMMRMILRDWSEDLPDRPGE